jgi:methylated-DNA-protein-cysteine methyltransferase related protein
MCPSHGARACFNNETRKKKIKMAKARKAAKQKKATDGIRSVRPSGKYDQSFFELVYEVARQIPKGRVTSYGAIAACLGTRLSARMVGWAMNGAHRIKPAIPAHRVVNRNGMLSGKHHFETPDKMQQLLEKEGIRVVNDTVVDFKNIFWDPALS